MRDQILELIKSIVTVSYKVTEELPYSNSGNPLYLKNPKVIYVDNPSVTVEQTIPVLNGMDIESEIQTVRVYLSNDAKTQPKDYLQLITNIRNVKYNVAGDFYKKECIMNTSLENDMNITTFEFNFYTIKG